MTDRLLCDYCIGTDDQHPIWTTCPYALEPYEDEGSTRGEWLLTAGCFVAIGLIAVVYFIAQARLEAWVGR